LIRSSSARSASGFSLVELIVVIVVTGIIAGVVGSFIVGPIQAFLDQARRAELVDAAQIALTRMGRDVKGALPNSVRVSGGALELLLTIDGDRYRTEPPGAAADVLDFTQADTSFDTFNLLGAGQSFSSPYLAIYPLGQPGADAYADPVMTPASVPVSISATPVTVGGASEYRVTLGGGGHRFPYASPQRRLFLVEGPVSWICDTAGGTLLRYAAYPVAAVQPVPPAVAPEMVVKHVEACAFQYTAGTAQRNSVATLALVLASGGERVRLVRQVHVENVP
jgi:MSHA biogenesis protein MshO